MSSRRGRFFVLEGLDGAGTTTQASLLAARLREEGHRVHLTAEPSRGPVGARIREALGGALAMDRRTLALLFAADRLDHLQREVRPHLDAGEHVVCDRYVLSSLAYQSLDAPRAWVAGINRFAPPPDATFFLQVRPAVAHGRRHAQSGASDIFETLPQLRRVARNYARDVRDLGRRQRVAIVDGEGPIEAVALQIWQRVLRRL